MEWTACSTPPMTIKTGYLPVFHHHTCSKMCNYPQNDHQIAVPSTFPLSSKGELQQQLELARCHLDDIEPDGQAWISISKGRHTENTYEPDRGQFLSVVIEETYPSTNTGHQMAVSSKCVRSALVQDRSLLLSVVIKRTCFLMQTISKQWIVPTALSSTIQVMDSPIAHTKCMPMYISIHMAPKWLLH